MSILNENRFNEVFNTRFKPATPMRDTRFETWVVEQLNIAEMLGEVSQVPVMTADTEVVRRLRRDHERDKKLQSLDTAVMGVIAAGLNRERDFSLAIRGDDDGPYARFAFDDDTITVTVASNYNHVEPKDSLFAAELSLLEWLSVKTDFYGRTLFLKSWPRDTDIVSIANAVALPLVHVFNSLRDGAITVVHTVEASELLEQAATRGRGVLGQLDFSHIPELAHQSAGAFAALHPSDTTPVHETKLGLLNIATAYEIAADHDDEVGLQTLSALKDDLEFRARYIEESMASVRALLADESLSESTELFDRMFLQAFSSVISTAIHNKSTVLVMDRGSLRRDSVEDARENITAASPCLIAGFLLEYDATREGYSVFYRDAGFAFDYETLEPFSGARPPLTTVTFDADTDQQHIVDALAHLALARGERGPDADISAWFNTNTSFYVLSEGGYRDLDSAWHQETEILRDQIGA